MADAVESIASAMSPLSTNSNSTLSSTVLVPKSEATNRGTTPTGATKRRQSSSSLSPHAKRARLATSQSPADSPAATPAVQEPTPAPSSTSTSSKHDQQPSNSDTQALLSPTSANHGASNKPLRRPTGPRVLPDQDKGRNKRLFGSLLGTLAQPSRTSTSKRKEDIERKQASKLRQRDEELEAAKQNREREAQVRKEEETRRRAQLGERRREQQRAWDQQSRRIQHGNTRAMAHFLRTEVEPRLYWRPYETLPQQEKRIKEQVEEVEAETRRELDEAELGGLHTNGLAEEVEDVEVAEGNTPEKKDPERSSETAQASRAEAALSADVSRADGSKATRVEGTRGSATPAAAGDIPQDTSDAHRLEENGDDHENDEIANAGEDAVIY